MRKLRIFKSHRPANFWHGEQSEELRTDLTDSVKNNKITTAKTSGQAQISNAVQTETKPDSPALALSTYFRYEINGTTVTQLSPGGIWTSTNSGTTWISNDVPFEANGWIGVASSADGVKLAATTWFVGVISISTNSGTTWSSNSVPGVGINNGSTLDSVASSADGNQLVVVAESLTSYNSSGIYIYQTTPSPQLNISPESSNLTLSWPIPSTNFVLQQSSDLTLWADVTNAPALNLTNLQNEVTLSPSNSSGFYRLKTP
jgi:hypothetical protein